MRNPEKCSDLQLSSLNEYAHFFFAEAQGRLLYRTYIARTVRRTMEVT
jgi:hypothetical protein